MRALAFLLALLLAAFAGPACAQFTLPGAPAAKPAAPPAAPALQGLTPTELQSVLDLLNNPQKRAAFEAQLQALAKANAATAPKAAPAVPLAPDSVGAEIIQKSASWLNELGGQAAAVTHLVGNVPALYTFTLRVANDPARRERVFQAGWHLALILLVAAVIEWIFDRLLRRPVRAIARAAPEGTDSHAESPDAVQTLLFEGAPGSETGEALGDNTDFVPPAQETAAAKHRRFTRTIRALRRLPFFLVRLVLELLSPALFLALAYGGMIVVDPATQAVLWVAITAYLAVRLSTAVTRSMMSPDYASLRMVHSNDESAAYTLVWIRRLAVVAGVGYAATQIGVQFGLPLAARDALIKAVALLDHLFAIIIILQCRRPVADRIRSHAARLTIMDKARNRLASVWHLIAIFFVVALWLVWAAQVRNGYAKMWRFFVVSIGIIIVARLIDIVLMGGLDRAFRIGPELSQRYPGLERRANRYYPMLRGFITVLLFVGVFLTLLQAWGVDVRAWFHTGQLGGKLADAAMTVTIAGIVALAVWESVNTGLDRHLAHLTRGAQFGPAARLRTLLPILRTVLMLLLVTVFGLTALSEIGVNIAPLLAGAGILGVAIGFGSQKLVQDFITGIFLLLENAMQVGDQVTVAGLAGAVENLSIRTMRLRAGDGSVHIIPFSSVSTVTNVNRGIGNAAVTVTVPLEEDTDHVSDVLSDIVRDMRAEQGFRDMMRSDFQLWGVDRVDAGNVTIVGQIVCTDGGRWAVQREFNRRMNIRFKEERIRIGTPVNMTRMVATAETAPKQLSDSQEDRKPPANQVTQSPPPSALGHGA